MEWNIGNEFSKSFTITEDMVVGFAQVSKDKKSSPP